MHYSVERVLSAAPGSTYTYGNADWKDLLTAFNGEKIVYEGQTPNEDGDVTGTPTSGNPIRYYNGTPWSFSWAEGRSLKTAESSTPEQDISLEFSYDADGLRIEKHVTKTVYKMTADHTYTDTVVAPTCTEAGYTLHECECGYSYTDTEVEALGHDYAEETQKIRPSCVGEGYTLHTCTRCGGTEKTDLVPPLGHRFSTEGVKVVEPTCTKVGYTRCICTVCAAAVVVNYVAPLGHDFQRVGISPVKTCIRCGLAGDNNPGITTPTQPSGSNYSLDEPIEPEVLPEEPATVSEEESESEATAPLRHRGVALATTTEEHSYIYVGGKLLRETISDGTTTKTLDFNYDNVGLPYSLIYNNGTTTTTYYYITNLQGDVMYLVDADGNEVAAYDYDPYGKVISSTGDLAKINPLRYRGYYYDTETGFYYLQSRYYDPEICRFINADSYASTGQGLLGYNAFAYCNSNPIVFSDGSGDAPWWALPYWGYIHAAVEDYIIVHYQKDIPGLLGEVSCSTGRMDLFDTNSYSVWEIKSAGPASLSGIDQLRRYTSGTYKGHSIVPGKPTFKGEFPYGEFYVKFWSPAPGLVVYDFDYQEKAAEIVTVSAYEKQEAELKIKAKVKGNVMPAAGMLVVVLAGAAIAGAIGGVRVGFRCCACNY